MFHSPRNSISTPHAANKAYSPRVTRLEVFRPPKKHIAKNTHHTNIASSTALRKRPKKISNAGSVMIVAVIAF